MPPSQRLDAKLTVWVVIAFALLSMFVSAHYSETSIDSPSLRVTPGPLLGVTSASDLVRPSFELKVVGRTSFSVMESYSTPKLHPIRTHKSDL